MPNFLTDSTSTSETDRVYLEPGRWVLSLETANASASVTFTRYHEATGGTGMAVEDEGTAVTLTPSANSVVLLASGAYYTATNADGSSAATVKAQTLPDS